MKKLLLCLLLGVGCHIAIAQQTAAIDSATMVVDRFLKILNYEAIRNDSILYVESTITTRNDSGDTLWMRRWFLWPNLNRTELWHEGVLKFGLVSNGHGRYRRFDETHIQKAHEAARIEAMLHENGFRDIQIFGDRTFRPPEADAPRIHFLAVRE